MDDNTENSASRAHEERITRLNITGDIVRSFIDRNNVATGDIPELIRSVHSTLVALDGPDPAKSPEAEYVPAVSVRKSLANPDHIISMIDGRPYKMLRRHLATHGLEPDEYRARYGLPADYPMTAPNYAEKRRALAKQIGLGTKGRGGGRKAKPKAA